jgi:hypothetical protein
LFNNLLACCSFSPCKRQYSPNSRRIKLFLKRGQSKIAELSVYKLSQMKKLLFLLFAALSIGVIAHAQPGRGQNPEAMKQMLKDSLQLSDKQLDSVSAILQEFQPKQREIFMDQSMSREDKMAKIQELNKQRNARLKAVLTEEQMKKYQDMEERRRQRQGAGRPGGN